MDRIDTTELAANQFRMTQTRDKLDRTPAKDQQQAIRTHEAVGSDEWIEKRVRGIAIRDELTNEWQKRGVKEQLEYAILTAEISRATFGMTPSEYLRGRCTIHCVAAGSVSDVLRWNKTYLSPCSL